MLDLLELLVRRRLTLLGAILALVGFAYLHNVALPFLDVFQKLEWNGQALTQSQIGEVVVSLGLLLFFVGLVIDVRRYLLFLLVIGDKAIAGQYCCSLIYDQGRIANIAAKLGKPPCWSSMQVLLPDDPSHSAVQDSVMQAMDRFLGFDFYAKYKWMETKLNLYLYNVVDPQEPRVTLLRGFGIVSDRSNQDGTFLESLIKVIEDDLSGEHNMIDLRRPAQIYELYSDGVDLILEIEQLVSPRERYRDFRIFLHTKVRRTFSGAWRFSEGVFYLRDWQASRYIAIAGTPTFRIA